MLLLLGAAQSAEAQRPSRSGFWLEVGGGPSHIRVGCTGCDDVTRRPGSGGLLRLGGALSDGVFMGVESFTLVDRAFGFAGSDDALSAENSSLAAIVLWFPRRHGMFIKGGIGLAVGDYTFAAPSDEPVRATGTGIGMTFGLGYDLPIWRSIALTGNLGAWVSAIGDIVLPAIRVDDVIATMYSFTVSVTVR